MLSVFLEDELPFHFGALLRVPFSSKLVKGKPKETSHLFLGCPLHMYFLPVAPSKGSSDSNEQTSEKEADAR